MPLPLTTAKATRKCLDIMDTAARKVAGKKTPLRELRKEASQKAFVKNMKKKKGSSKK